MLAIAPKGCMAIVNYSQTDSKGEMYEWHTRGYASY
jgi:hypothetical protein